MASDAEGGTDLNGQDTILKYFCEEYIMKIYVCKTYEEMSKKAADVMGAQLILKPDSVLGLATGSSPLGLYSELADRCARGEITFKDVKTVNLDEYCGLSPDNDQSYSYFMHKNLFNKVDILPENVNLPDGTNADAAAETARYDALIASLGGVDMQLLGIGVDGHIGFNEPDDYFPGMTHEVKLTEMTIDANKRFFASADEVPRAAFTMGIGTIMAAKKIVMVVTGRDKREILKKTFWGPVDPQVPASILQFHPDVTLVCDEEAYPF